MGLLDHLHQHTHQTTVNRTITENRAPTDESVKLLREMERKAEEEIVKAIPIKNNLVEGVVIQKQFSPVVPELKTIVLFKLNGEPFRITVDMPSPLSQEDAVKVFVEGLMKGLTQELVKALLK
jgi:hypothetical protein